MIVNLHSASIKNYREPVRRAEDAWAEDALAEDLRAEDARAEVF